MMTNGVFVSSPNASVCPSGLLIFFASLFQPRPHSINSVSNILLPPEWSLSLYTHSHPHTSCLHHHLPAAAASRDSCKKRVRWCRPSEARATPTARPVLSGPSNGADPPPLSLPHRRFWYSCPCSLKLDAKGRWVLTERWETIGLEFINHGWSNSSFIHQDHHPIIMFVCSSSLNNTHHPVFLAISFAHLLDARNGTVTSQRFEIQGILGPTTQGNGIQWFGIAHAFGRFHGS